MEWLRQYIPYDPVRPTAEPKGIEQILMQLFGGAADREHERWLKFERARRENAGLPAVAEPTPDPTMPPAQQERTLMEREAAGENVYGTPRDYHFGNQGPAPAFSADVGYAAPPTDSVDDIRSRNQQQVLDMFREMNPSFDYAAAAEQSGGNVPGGSYSEFQRGNVPKAQTDEEFIRWVNEDLPLYEAQRKMDPRSREYDPDGAQMIYDRKAQIENAQSQKIYSDAQMLRSNADMLNAQAVQRKMQMQNTPQGQVGVLVGALMESIDPMTDKEIANELRDIMVMNAMGDYEGAMRRLQNLKDIANAKQGQADKAGAPIAG